MSLIDKVVAAVTPPESEAARAQARAKARASATSGDWLSMVLDHHLQIESAFAAVKEAADAAGRLSAQKKLAVLLTGHSIAEEAVIYPALVKANEEGHSTKAYTEQSAAKVQMGLLEDLPPMSQEYLDKLEHLRGAVAHHVYEEEGNWFLALRKKLPTADQTKLTQRYKEQFSRYAGESDDKAARLEALRVQPGRDISLGADGNA
ncbi:MAG: hemerythrin domain-containing protein [Pseudomonadota bacterium]|nr:hemerythrin domain-containing protein [Pseudomonadota bacterium]